MVHSFKKYKKLHTEQKFTRSFICFILQLLRGGNAVDTSKLTYYGLLFFFIYYFIIYKKKLLFQFYISYIIIRVI